MKEAVWLNRVIALAEQFGWRAWHVAAPMRATPAGFVGDSRAAGLPDLVLIHDDPPRLIFAELKGTGGRLSGKQREFLSAARMVRDRSADLAHVLGAGRSVHTLGVYAWFPEDEQIVEQILRSRVLA